MSFIEILFTFFRTVAEQPQYVENLLQIFVNAAVNYGGEQRGDSVTYSCLIRKLAQLVRCF